MPIVRNGRGEKAVYEIGLEGQPSGPVERRTASAAERAAWQAASPPSPLARRAGTFDATDAERTAAAHRGGEANRQRRLTEAQHAAFGVGHDPKPPTPLISVAEPPVIPEEEPVMATPAPVEDPLAVALNALNEASLEAIEAYSSHQIAEGRWERARQALEAAYRDTGLLAIQGDPPTAADDVDWADGGCDRAPGQSCPGRRDAGADRREGPPAGRADREAPGAVRPVPERRGVTMVLRPARTCSTCGFWPCRCGQRVENRPLRARPRLETCVCGGPEIVAASGLEADIRAGVQRHQIEPTHIAWDEANGTPLSQEQLRVKALDDLARELVGVG